VSEQTATECLERIGGFATDLLMTLQPWEL
jgi:hypothetical protein